jgi:putative transposase
MPRPPRPDLPGVPHHVIQRGNNRTACFFGDADRRFYLSCIAESAVRRGCAVHAYVLMSNHVHLLVTPSVPGAVAAMLQDLGRRYVRVVNTIHGRTGTLWEGRFKSSLIDSDHYLFACHRYIELNPVRAGMVKNPADYPWSSYSYYAAGRPNRLVSEHPLYRSLGETDADRRTAFHSLTSSVLDERLTERIRRAVNTDSALGSEAFMDRAESVLGRSVRPPVRGRPVKPITEKLL